MALDPNAPAQPSAADLPPEALALASKLFDFARSGSTSDLSTYLTAGIPSNLTNSKGDTLLMLAAYHGHAESVSLLLSRGADSNVLNDRGQSPLAGAVFKGYDDVVKALVDSGADATLGTPSAKDTARMFGKTELFGILGVTEEEARERLPGQIGAQNRREERRNWGDGRVCDLE
jgi:uncharacterized protein